MAEVDPKTFLIPEATIQYIPSVSTATETIPPTESITTPITTTGKELSCFPHEYVLCMYRLIAQECSKFIAK